MSGQTGFVAYPSSPAEIASTICAAVEEANATSRGLRFETWEEGDIAGRPISLPVTSSIEKAEVLVADVTRLNFNVTYEIGYAIGIQRRTLLVRSSALTADEATARRVGIFDTLGHISYATSSELASALLLTQDFKPLPISSETDPRAPAYLLETPVRTPEMTRIVARVKRARLMYRSFTPSEDARLSALDAISHVSRSIGVVIPLLSPEFQDAEVHNLRAAFVAGLSHGMGKITLVLQDGRRLVPLDLRDAAETYMSLDDINSHVEQFAGDVYEMLQGVRPSSGESGSGLLRISLGDPMAENEFQTLSSYYVQTDGYNRALRGEVNLVVGRKGTGKTALFFQVRDRVRRDKRNVVIDLKPEGYQLLKLKERVLDFLAEGAKTHLITAFWEYLLLLEICRKVVEKDKGRHRFDLAIEEDIANLERLLAGGPATAEGDFSERLSILSDSIISAYKANFGTENQVRLTADEVTNLLHTTFIAELREALADYLGYKDSVLVLFDNLDKGWSYKGISEGEILILRSLIDAARKVQRDMRKDDVHMSCIVFVRNDIYELLMDSSPDFGKEARASLDWNDPDLLREMLRRRLAQALDQDASFDQLWGLVCVPLFHGDETSQLMIERSLMRPRNLLKLVGHCKAFAANLNHERIEPEDIEKGMRAYSNDVVLEADRELADVEPAAGDLLYEFVGEPCEMSEEHLHGLLSTKGLSSEARERVCDYLLYLGFLGVRLGQDEPRYIYNFGYDLQILKAVVRKSSGNYRFILNPAFWSALEVAV